MIDVVDKYTESLVKYKCTVCLGSTNNLTLCWLFHLNNGCKQPVRRSSIIKNVMMYDAVCPLSFFFQNSQSKNANTKCMGPDFAGKWAVPILAIYFRKGLPNGF